MVNKVWDGEVLQRLKDGDGRLIGKKIAFISGNFNILHPGHLRFIRFAKECADILVVGVNSKSSPGAILPEIDRLNAITALSWVDHAFIVRDSIEDILQSLRPHVVVKGKEFEKTVNSEEEILRRVGGELVFGSGQESYSYIDEMLKTWQDSNQKLNSVAGSYMERHNFSPEYLRQAVFKFSSLNVCVIGDSIVDEYIHCDPIGLSREDPTIVVTPLSTMRFIGGAAIVAAHTAGFGANVSFLSITGEDCESDFLRQELSKGHINLHFSIDDSRPTTLKQRFRTHGKTLLRVSRLRQHAISRAIRDKILDEAKSIIPKTDLLIFSDFSYGCLPQEIVEELSREAKKFGVVLAADSQSSSQVGDITRFKGMDLITPTEREARIAIKEFDAGLPELSRKLQSVSKAKNVAITLGVEGVFIHSPNPESHFADDRLPAFNENPRDPAGAGDTFLVLSALALVVGCDIWQAAYLGSVGAGIHVSYIGNKVMGTEKLLKGLGS